MEFVDSEGDDVRLLIHDDDDEFHPSPSPFSSSKLLCRVCHEEEDGNSAKMESPCACSGSLKFAHRACIQRWCNEKGNTVCEICLQKFEPGYTVPPKLALLDIAVTIRGSLEVPRLNYETQEQELSDIDESDRGYPDCSSPSSNTTATFIKSLSLFIMLGLLVGHLIVVLVTGEDGYPFAIETILILRASSILLPFYFILKIVSAIRSGQQQHRRRLQFHRRGGSQTEETEEPQDLEV